MNKLIYSISILSLLLLTDVATAASTDVIATVNGKPIKQSMLDLMAKQSASGGQKVDEATKKALLEALIDREVLAQEAEKAGIDKTPEFASRIELVRQELLATTYVRDKVKKPATDEVSLRLEYDKLKERLGTKEYNVRQIVVATEDEAKSVISQLSKGSDFATLAKEKSTDESTKEKGGSIGWVIPAVMRRPFDNIISSLPKGLYTTVPIKTTGGWVILKVDDIRDKEPPAFEEVKGQLAQRLNQENIGKVVKELRAKAKITNNLKELPTKK